MYDQFNRNILEAFEPLQRLVQLTLDHTEKLANFQIDAAKAYTEFGVEQARGALTITDTVSLHDYLSKQQDTAKTLARKLSDDTQAIVGFGKEFADGASDLARDSIERTPNPASAVTGKNAA